MHLRTVPVRATCGLAILLWGGLTACHRSVSATDSLEQTGSPESEAVHFRAGPDPHRAVDQYAIRSWDTSTGLPQNSIQDIVQRPDGALWIATQEGLVYFDGLDFTTFNQANTPEIRGNDISTLAIDEAGSLWIGTFSGGLLRYADGRFSAWTAADGLPGNSILDLCPHGGGEGIWVATRDRGAFFFDGDVVRQITAAEGLPSERTSCIHSEPDGSLWIGTAAGLFRQNGEEHVLFDSSHGLIDDAITAIAEGLEGDLWIGTQGGLNHLTSDGISTVTTADGLSSNTIQVIRVDAGGTVWIGTAAGLNRLTPDGTIAILTEESGLSADMVASLLLGRDGILWVGTHGGGLNLLRDSRVTGFTTAHGLTSNIVYAVAPAGDGGVWTGSFAGDIDHFRAGGFENVVAREAMGSTRIRCLQEDTRGNLWIGTDTALFRLSRDRLTRCRYAAGSAQAPIRVIYEDRDGSLLVGTDGAGVFRMDGTRLVPWLRSPELGANSIRTILRDGEGRLWIGTYGGLTRCDESGFHTYTHSSGLPSPQAEYIRSLTTTADGSLWIGTYGGGLLRFRDDEFTSITTADGLPNNGLYQLVNDRRGGLWMSSNVGLFRISLADLDRFAAGELERITVLTFTESEGMPSRECNGGNPGGLFAPDGRLWVPTLGGLARVDPAGLEDPVPAPPAILKDVLVDGRAIGREESRALAANPQRIEFHFSAVNFLAPERTQFRYRLEGFEETWTVSGAAGIAQYTQLAPGEYTFELAASRDGSTWSDEAAIWAFRIKPALTETALFWLLTVMLAGSIVWLGIRRRVQEMERTERLLQERVEAALAEVQTLSGMLPICSHCKKIRDDSGYWNQIETYVRAHSDAEFSHGLCPECVKELYPEFADEVITGKEPDREGERPGRERTGPVDSTA